MWEHQLGKSESVGTHGRVQMPEVLANLVDAEKLLWRNVSVAGQCFLECFAGATILTLGCVFACVPCMVPWDTAYGKKFDVLANGEIILALIEHARISMVHLAVPCDTFTLARIPQLRSWLAMWGRRGLKWKD